MRIMWIRLREGCCCGQIVRWDILGAVQGKHVGLCVGIFLVEGNCEKWACLNKVKSGRGASSKSI